MTLIEAAEAIYAIFEEYGEWDEGCFYYNRHAAPELQTPLRNLDEAIHAHNGPSTLPPGYMDRVHDRIADAGKYLDLLEEVARCAKDWSEDCADYRKQDFVSFALEALRAHRAAKGAKET